MKEILKIFFKNKLKTLIILVVLLLFNSYAWFIYATRVSSSLTVHITSWNIIFQSGEDETTTNVSFTVDRMYPGMTPYSQSVVAQNNGEMPATLTYEINSVTILGTTYEVDENTTSADLLDMVQNDFPFVIDITVDNDNLQAGTGEGEFTISLEWLFESGDDATDTYWGEQAYTFYATHPNTASISMAITIIATQNN